MLNLNELQNEKERVNQSGSNQASVLDDYVKMPKSSGNVVVRLLPPADGKPFYVATRRHEINCRSYHCLRELVNGKWIGECPICSYYSHLWEQVDRQPTEELKQPLATQARAIKPVERFYYNVVIRKCTGENGEQLANVGPKILSVGKKLHQLIITGIVGDKNAGVAPLGDVTDPTAGFDFLIVKSIQGGYPNYDQSRFLGSTPLGVEIKDRHDLTKIVNKKTVDELKRQLKIHLGIIPDDANGFDIEKFFEEIKK